MYCVCIYATHTSIQIMKRSSHNYLSRDEELYYKNQYTEHVAPRVKHVGALLLDSSLISTTDKKNYYIKIIDCGMYKQVYYYNKIKTKKDNNKEEFKKIDTTFLFKEENIKNKEEKKYIEQKNVDRSKFNLQRIIKSNEKEFKTFITLTFEDDIIDIEIANKRFKYWRDVFQRNYKDFKYVCVPEFQKNGKVHYHLLTNLDYQDLNMINENILLNKLKIKLKNNKYKLINKSYKVIINKEIKLNDLNIVLRRINNKLENTKKTYNYKSKTYKIFKTIKYWNNGYSNILNMNVQDMNVVGYLTKYMTKDIDNRLFGRQRYLFSRNLIIPKEYYIDCNNENEFNYYLNIVNKSNIVYKHKYLDKLENEIEFIEYKIKDNEIDKNFNDILLYK